MPPTLPSPHLLRRPSLPNIPKPTQNSSRTFTSTPEYSAQLIRRAQRPYTFTQLITLSDGSSYTHRTTSPVAVYKSAKDIRNTPLWNPSNMKLANVEQDQAGRLRAFRKRFGRGWDAQEQVVEEDEKEEEEVVVVDGIGARVDAQLEGSKIKSKEQIRKEREEKDENLMDLIGAYSTEEERNANVGSPGDYRAVRSGKKGKK